MDDISADLAAAALDYAERGWPVFPCDPQSKHPIIENGLHAATTDATQIRSWWRKWPFAMIGVRTGPEANIFVVDPDVDSDKGIDGFIAIAELETQHSALPDTLRAVTPRGGEHLYFRWRDGIKNSASKLGDGIDVRGQNGYVIAPPSIRSDRKAYQWREDCAPQPVEAPDWLIALLTAPEAVAPVPPAFANGAAPRVNGNGDRYANAALDHECANVAGTPAGQRNHALNTAAFSLGQLVAGGVLTEGEVKSRLFDAANACGLVKDDGAAAVNNTIKSGLRAGMKQPRTAPEPIARKPPIDPEVLAEAMAHASTSAKKDEKPPPLPFINMQNWDSEPIPEQEWAVLNRIPRRQCVLFSGEGAAGKSTVELHRSAAHVLGRDWLGSMPEMGPVIHIDAEDGEDVIHRRLAAVIRHYGVTFADLIKGGLHIMSFAGKDAVIATVNRSGKVEPTPLYKQLLEAAGDIRPTSITIASCANVFAGDEINRSQVQQFVGLLTRMAIVADGSAALVSHPSQTGIKDDTGLSGSTQWHNAVRARFYMKGIKPDSGEQPDDDLREIVFKKNQYGKRAESIALRWSNGMFLPLPGASPLDKIAREAKADEAFRSNILRFANQGRNTSAKPNAPTYAPTEFAKDPEAKLLGFRKADFEAAMRRLLAAGKIKVEPYGPPSRGWTRLVRADNDP